MDNTTFALELNALVSRFLEESGDPSICAETLREIADDVFGEYEGDDGICEGLPY